MPPSFSISVGVPPATVTASLMLSVSVTMLPIVRSPVPLVIPAPEVAIDATVGSGDFKQNRNGADGYLSAHNGVDLTFASTYWV